MIPPLYTHFGTDELALGAGSIVIAVFFSASKGTEEWCEKSGGEDAVATLHKGNVDA